MKEQVDAVCANLRSDKISARKVCGGRGSAQHE